MKSIYLDHAATTPLRPEVLEAMLPYMTEHYGNPSSVHFFGRASKAAIDAARDSIAAHLQCSPREIIFTSGGTESDNLAVLGIALSGIKTGKRHVITTQIEHHAILHACRYLESQRVDVTYIPVDRYGQADAEQIAAAIRPETALISMMFGNNEVGTLQPVEEVGRLARDRGIPFHVDGVQALGMLPIDLSRLPIDLISFAGHKINGPKGTGLLYVNKRYHVEPRLFGGAQERKLRAGTENVAGIVGFAKAFELAVDGIEQRVQELEALRQAFIETLDNELGREDYVINGHSHHRLPHILNVSFPSVLSETLLMNLDLEGVAAASGSACSSGSLEPSHVLLAMGLGEAGAKSSVRFSFGFGTVHRAVTIAAKKTATIVSRLRKK